MAKEQPPSADPALEVSSPEHFKALAHPTRQRIMFALSQPATVSQLATAIGTAKGNIAHHLGVLRGAGLVSPAGTRQVRGGTEQYFQRAAPVMRFTGEHAAANLPIAFGAVAEEIAAADPDPFLVLRYLRLTPAQVSRITAVLTDLAGTTEDDQPGQARPGPEPAIPGGPAGSEGPAVPGNVAGSGGPAIPGGSAGSQGPAVPGGSAGAGGPAIPRGSASPGGASPGPDDPGRVRYGLLLGFYRPPDPGSAGAAPEQG